MSIVRKIIGALSGCAVLIGSAAFVSSVAGADQDKYSVKVPGGLAFSEFKGYESWEAVSVSYNEHAVAVIGVRSDAVLINDPWFGRAWHSKAQFEPAYATFKQMAVILGS